MPLPNAINATKTLVLKLFAGQCLPVHQPQLSWLCGICGVCC